MSIVKIKKNRLSIKGSQIWKEVKLSLFADDTLYVENPKDSTKKLLELINEFSKTAEYNKQYTKMLFLYFNKLFERN